MTTQGSGHISCALGTAKPATGQDWHAIMTQGSGHISCALGTAWMPDSATGAWQQHQSVATSNPFC